MVVHRCMAVLFTFLSLFNEASPALMIFTEIDPPNQSLDAEGRLKGMSVDVVREIQKRTGSTDLISVVPWARGYAKLQGRLNVVLFTTAQTEERKPLFKWVGPIDERRYALYVRADASTLPTSLEEAKTLGRIGVYRNDVRDQILTQEGFSNLDRTTESVANVQKLMAKRVDAIASSPMEIERLVSRAGYKKEDVKETLVFARSLGYIAFSSATPDKVVNSWHAALDAMKRDRTFEHIYWKYYPGQPLPGTPPIRR